MKKIYYTIFFCPILVFVFLFFRRNVTTFNKALPSIDRETMACIITDLELSKAIVANLNIESFVKDKKISKYKDEIFKSYGIDEDKFVCDCKIYAKNLENFVNIYNEVNHKLEEIQKNY